MSNVPKKAKPYNKYSFLSGLVQPAFFAMLDRSGSYRSFVPLTLQKRLYSFLWLFTAKLSRWVDWNWMQRIWHLLPLICAAGAIYFACLFISGMRWRDFKLSAE